MQDGVNLAERRRNASNAILGASAAACNQQGTKGTTGPLNSTSGDTTYADSDGQVCFV